jgi:hypothetical protein
VDTDIDAHAYRHTGELPQTGFGRLAVIRPGEEQEAGNDIVRRQVDQGDDEFLGLCDEWRTSLGRVVPCFRRESRSARTDTRREELRHGAGLEALEHALPGDRGEVLGHVFEEEREEWLPDVRVGHARRIEDILWSACGGDGKGLVGLRMGRRCQR